MVIRYAHARWPVRADIAAAHARAWDRLARPGAWWTAAQRVAIALEARAASGCALCRTRRAALSPNAVAGTHGAASALPPAALDVIHRVVTDSGRLSKAWFDGVMAAGLSDGQYVELIGVVGTVVSVDAFCRGIGVAVHPLPAPEAGEPSGYRPPGARDDGAWVAMIPQAAATGNEAGLYGDVPRTGNVIRALSLVPDEVRQLRDLGAAHYLSERQMMDLTAGRSLDRTQIELLAGRVSVLRACFY